MYDISTLKPGDVVRIVDEWIEANGRQNNQGLMDKYLGGEMTVQTIEKYGGSEYYATMVEDQDDRNVSGGWYWFNEMIAGLSADEDFEVCDDILFSSIMS